MEESKEVAGISVGAEGATYAAQLGKKALEYWCLQGAIWSIESDLRTSDEVIAKTEDEIARLAEIRRGCEQLKKDREKTVARLAKCKQELADRKAELKKDGLEMKFSEPAPKVTNL